MSKGPSKSSSKFNAASYARPGLSEDEVNQIKYAFDLFDTDQGGSIDTKQLKAAMVSLGFDSKNAVIFQMISDLDEDGSGVLQFDEWIHLMTSRISEKDSSKNVGQIFNLFDDQKTGSITVKNLRRVAQDLGENITEEELNEMIDRASTTGDGLVSAEDFYEIITRKIKG